MFVLSGLISLILNSSPYSSVVYLRADPDGVGTGWVVDAEKKHILTCRHVVGEQTKLEVFFPEFRRGALVSDATEYLGRRPRLRESGRLVTGKVLRTSDELDLALIELPALPPGTRALPLADKRPSLGDTVRSFGHRGDIDTLWNATEGSVRQRGRLADGYFWQSKKLGVDLPSLVLQSPIEVGDSGGPVLNARGEVVGMISGLRRRAPLAAVGPDASAIRIFLKRIEPPAKVERSIADNIARSTVWLRPTATDVRCAGVLIDRERRFVLTSASGVGALDRVGATFPLIAESGEIVGESAAYKDGVDLLLAKRWSAGTVLHRDLRRDLALVKLDSVPDGVKAVSLAEREPGIADKVFAISHPTGLEFAFVASVGSLRQRGSVALAKSGTFAKPGVNLFQLPATGASPGGPICNERGELLGVQAAKDGPLQQCYAASLAEVRMFLAEAPPLILVRTFAAIWSQIDTFEELGELGRGRLTPAFERFRASDWAGAIAACDSVLLRFPQDREALLLRAGARKQAKQYPAALGDAQRWLELSPGDTAFRELAVGIHVAAGDTAKAAEERKRIERLMAVPK